MKTGITFNLDATSCYDCILALLSTLACHSVGMEINVCQMHTETLTHAEFCLKTSIGISDGLYQHTETTPIHGTGQGSGNSPQIWCFISNALFNAFASEAHGACFASFNGDIRQTIHMIGFVDDCSQQLNYLWRDLLYASGGDLKLPKCFFQLIQSDFKPNGIPFLCNRIFAPPVTVQNQTMTVLITQKNNYTSNQTLDCTLKQRYYLKRATTWQAYSSQIYSHATKFISIIGCYTCHWWPTPLRSRTSHLNNATASRQNS